MPSQETCRSTSRTPGKVTFICVDHIGDSFDFDVSSLLARMAVSLQPNCRDCAWCISVLSAISGCKPHQSIQVSLPRRCSTSVLQAIFSGPLAVSPSSINVTPFQDMLGRIPPLPLHLKGMTKPNLKMFLDVCFVL